jgi:V8-like Glu-specific endopeptidase
MNFTTALISMLAMFLANNLYSAQKMIYGEDNRVDYFLMPYQQKELADSVVSLWENSSVKLDSSSNSYKLETENFGKRMNLCPEEPFKEQPIGAFCSGALVADDIVMTAGHCITDENSCKDTKIVFGYMVKKANSQAITNIPQNEVYSCKAIIKRQQGVESTEGNEGGEGLGPDYALIKLDRKVTNHKPLAINRNQELKKGQPMYVIGYPVGLPIKLANDAKVRDPQPEGYFVADLDTFGGNSGSPVFNAKTNLIEGILVRGDTDFEKTPSGCTVSYKVSQDEGRGEDVTKISVLSKYIPINKSIENTDSELEMNVDSSQIDITPNLNANNVSFDR